MASPNSLIVVLCSLLCGLSLMPLATVAESTNDPPAGSGRDYYDLGGFHRRVTANSEFAQTWFDRGLAMCHAFNHEEAVRCFELAYAADPGMPMALWGMAYAWGPNINNMQVSSERMARAYTAIQLAQLQASRATQLERDLIGALGRRYAVPVPEDRDSLNKAYADAMREVQGKYPDEPLVAATFAESLMNLRPWGYWSKEGEPASETAEIVETLESGLSRWPTDPALCHFYIHAIEASPHPEKALPAANRLRDAMPGAGHLVHMPSHIDVLVGDYQNVIRANQLAIKADTVTAEREGVDNFYTYYRIHNYHFLAYGAMFDGQRELALKAARELVDEIPQTMLREQADFLDAFVPTPLHVLVRFGDWEQILAEPEPPEYLPVARSIRHYARAIALAALGRVDDAEAEQDAFEEASEAVPETSFLFNNSCLDILGVAEKMVAGEIAYRRDEIDEAFAFLREAVQRDDELHYDEPWGWMQPARHALGALLLEQNQFAAAEAVYRADLQRHPNNPWALHGLAECLDRQSRAEEAALVQREFESATARADVRIDRSCFCRLGDG